MKHKKILLVANDNLEVLNVQRELTRHHIDHSLHVAKNGLDALALLMGCSSPQLENYTKTGKVQPDIILMDAESPELHMIELLCIMQKYYSLQKIRVFLMVSDPNKIALSEAEKLGIAGIVSKPFNIESTQFDAQKLRNEFGTIPQKAWLPLAGLLPVNMLFSKGWGFFVKVKGATVQLAGAFGAKTAVAGAMIIGGTLLSSSFTENTETETPYEKTKVVAKEKPAEFTSVEQVEIMQPETPVIIPKKSTRKKTILSTAPSEATDNTPEKTPDRVFRIVVTEDEAQPTELN